MTYPSEFEEFWENYLEEHECPTEGYDDAKAVAFNMWGKLPTEPVQSVSHSFVITGNELSELLSYAEDCGVGNNHAVKVEVTQTGIGASIQVSQPDGSNPQDVTDVSNW